MEDKVKLPPNMLVYTIFTFDLAQTALGTHEAWWYTVQNWGNVPALQLAPWTAATVAITCGLSTSDLEPTANVLGSYAGYCDSIDCASSEPDWDNRFQKDLSQENLLKMHSLFTLWLTGSFVADILVAGGMIWILQTSKSGSETSQIDGLLNRLILNTIQTGIGTVVCAGVDLVVFIRITDTNYFMTPVYILGKLYTISFMVTLNLRAPRKHRTRSQSIGLRIHVSQTTERTIGSIKLPSENRTLSDWQNTDLGRGNIAASISNHPNHIEKQGSSSVDLGDRAGMCE
ncbi:hypothetical protein C8R43DRAFT_959755 [Mycena crocata]|nr:hypothetical protein C8R43DRAFT_959755 [Mycena crocata]